MAHREGHDLESIIFQHHPGPHLNEVNLERGLGTPQHHAVD